MEIKRINAVSIGRPATMVLKNGSRGWCVVHSVFNRSINLKIAGEFITIGSLDLLNQPYGLLCGDDLVSQTKRIKPNERIQYFDSQIWFPKANVQIQYANASVWNPELRIPIRGSWCKGIVERLDQVKRIAIREVPKSYGLGVLLLHSERILAKDTLGFAEIQGYQNIAANVLHSLVQSIHAKDMKRVAEFGKELLGLGPGLTPSGDDVLGGLLTTLIVTVPDEEMRTCLIEVTRQIAQIAKYKTTEVSVRFLHQAGQGFVTERLQNVLKSIVLEEYSPNLEKDIRKILAFGATSGGEILLGSILGLGIIVNQVCGMRSK